MNEPTDLESLRRAIAALPERLRVAGDEEDAPASAPPADGPLAVIARQGRLILRLTAAAEATEGRLKALTDAVTAEQSALAAARETARRAEEETLRVTREAILPLIDALEWSAEAARTRGDAALAESLAGAVRDSNRRLAAVGITAIPAEVGTPFDGRLHEAVEARPAPAGSAVARYAILAVVRRGWQRGAEVLRRATVITAE